MIDIRPRQLLVLNSRLKLQIFEKEVPKKQPQGRPMTHASRRRGDLASKSFGGKAGRYSSFSFEAVQSDQNVKARQINVSIWFLAISRRFLMTKLCPSLSTADLMR